MTLRDPSRFSAAVSTSAQPLRSYVYSKKSYVEKTFEGELDALRSFFQKITFLSLTLAFMLGLILGSILSSVPAVFIIATLAFGFPVAIAYGSANGVAPLLSMLAAAFVNCLLAYTLLRIIRLVEAHPRIAPYVNNIRSTYAGTSRRLLSHAGRFGIAGSLAIFTFLIGWWVSTLTAYILDVEEGTAMKGICAGALVGGVTSLAIFQGLLAAVPNPGIISLIFVTIFVVSAYLTRRASRRKKSDR